MLSAALPGDGPIGEAWILSDRDDHPSLVANGPLKGMNIRQLMEQSPRQLMGRSAGRFSRFPLLLKFLDVHERLSVQVHPHDGDAGLIPKGETGKTEAWMVLRQGPESRIYAGLKVSTTAINLRDALANGAVEGRLASFVPNQGDSVLVRAGTVHSLNDVVVFEVQENSDVTFRLYDWDHIDPATGERRPLQVDQALSCVDFNQGAITPLPSVIEEMTPVLREEIIHCEHFTVWRTRGDKPFKAGATDTPRILVCISGKAHLEYDGTSYPVKKGDVVLLPAVVGVCSCRPRGAVTMLEIALPEGSSP